MMLCSARWTRCRQQAGAWLPWRAECPEEPTSTSGSRSRPRSGTFLHSTRSRDDLVMSTIRRSRGAIGRTWDPTDAGRECPSTGVPR